MAVPVQLIDSLASHPAARVAAVNVAGTSTGLLSGWSSPLSWSVAVLAVLALAGMARWLSRPSARGARGARGSVKHGGQRTRMEDAPGRPPGQTPADR